MLNKKSLPENNMVKKRVAKKIKNILECVPLTISYLCFLGQWG